MTESPDSPEAAETPAADLPAGDGYQVIARRYRPRYFHEVVGQEATAETLRQAIRHQRIAHAYLFCGPRGVGKTSMARIFARALQCPNSENGDPCDRCATCDRIFRGEDINVTEMDGASHRGIEDVRDLIQHVRYVPTDGDYRIFIIDEVHMLTREAFNALLKTLEEPPPHVKFIFATTEPEKMPATVISRCQRCDFSAISNEDIVRRLAQICEMEEATPQEGLLTQVADLARGGMRDSQSLLDQLLSFAGSAPTTEDLDRITGRLSPAQIKELVEELDRGDRAAVVRRLDEVAKAGTDPGVLLEQVAEAFRDAMHHGVIEEGWGDGEIERNLMAQEILQEARLRVRQLTRSDIVLELALLRITTLSDLVPLRRLIESIEGGGQISGGPSPGEPAAPPRPRHAGGASATENGAARTAPDSGHAVERPPIERPAAEARPPEASAPSPRESRSTSAPTPAPERSAPEPAPEPRAPEPRATETSSADDPSTVSLTPSERLARERAAISAEAEQPAAALPPDDRWPEETFTSPPSQAARREEASPSPAPPPAPAAPTPAAASESPSEETNEPPAEPAPASPPADSPPATGEIDLDRVRESLEAVSAMLARVVGDGFSVAGETLTIRAHPMAMRQLDLDKRDRLGHELEQRVGRRLRIVVEETTEGHEEEGEEGAPAAPAAEAAPPGEVPDIVKRAEEIFRGSLFSDVVDPPDSSR